MLTLILSKFMNNSG